MEVKKGNKEASTSINIKISELRESPTQRCIYKVHKQYIHNANDKIFEPAVVAIGPYHRGKQGLKMMEEHKVRYLKSLLLRKEENVERYISAAAEMEDAARSCYAEAVDLTSAEFIEMLVLDACFIIELLRRSSSNSRDSSSRGHDHDPILDACFIIELLRRSSDFHDHDPIFEMEWILCSLRRDLILFENQIPFFVLCKMFDLIEEPNEHEKLIKFIRLFIGAGPINTNLQEVKHLLHLKHSTERPSSDVYNNLRAFRRTRREFRLIPTATELEDANVRFRKSEGENQFELDFKNGVLTMAPFPICDETESFFRNLVVYEQYFPDGKPTYVTDFVVLFDCLINTARDVEILSHCGIIDNMVGDNQAAADILNRLGHSLFVSETYFIYGDTFCSINDHYKKRWNRARAALNREYFNTPWAYISFVAAVFLLVLTLAQTVFSALQLS